jgi:hypothetical protein
MSPVWFAAPLPSLPAAAERGVPLGVIVDVYLNATSLAWRQMPRPPGVEPDDTATTVLRATNDAIAAVTDGYEAAQRMAIRTEEASRREFVDDLLHGTSDPTRLPELATRHGLQLAGGYVVAVATAADPFTDADERTRQVEPCRVRTGRNRPARRRSGRGGPGSCSPGS